MKIHVVAAIIQKNDRVLITQRNPDCKREPNKWEFPGGKIEPGETPEQSLKREIKEELDVEIKVGELFGESVKKYQNGEEIILSCYFAKLKNNKKPKPIGCQNIKWITMNEIDKYDMADADIEIVQLLRIDQEID